MNVLSLFDGISCGQIALNRAGIGYDRYFASEIDDKAIKVAIKNYPDTQEVGDVTQLKADDLPKIDLLIGGSPCQGFSYAGKRLNFDDPRSKLFFEYVRLLNELKPKWFLLENVRMPEICRDVISEYLGVQPLRINSNIVSAQSRERYYWTNIPQQALPSVCDLKLKDVKEPNLQHLATYRYDAPAPDLDFYPIAKHSSKSGLMCVGGLMRKGCKLWIKDGVMRSSTFGEGNRVYSENGKTATMKSQAGGLGGKTGLYEIDGVIRKLTRTECERLQTVPEGYTSCVSPTTGISLLGNGWTVEVISTLFKGIS